MAFSLLIASILISQSIACADESVIVADVGLSPLIATIPLSLTLGLGISTPLGIGCNNKQPIFGNKRFKPKWDKPTEKLNPIFSQEFRESVTPKKKKENLQYLKIFTMFLIISLAIVPLGLFSRETIDRDGRFIRYNTFNKIVHQTDISKAQSLTIDIEKGGGSRTTNYYISFDFKFEDSKYSFKTGDFMLDTRNDLEYMLYLKSFFKEDEYTISHADRVPELIDDNDYDQAEADLVYQLFDYK